MQMQQQLRLQPLRQKLHLQLGHRKAHCSARGRTQGKVSGRPMLRQLAMPSSG